MMDRAAVFVDAGYLFAQGSVAISGQKQKRTDLVLDEVTVRAELVAIVGQACELPLLRIYWYDGAPTFRGPSAEHNRLAYSRDIKLRLGYVNGSGEQKGVDAMLLSGDEDVRIGVQVAQTFGVRVHLVGIHPSRGSQSPLLLQEADTTTEWNAATVSKFLSMTQPALTAASVTPGTQALNVQTKAEDLPNSQILQQVTIDLVEKLKNTDIVNIKTYWSANNNRGVPPEFDRLILMNASQALGALLDEKEKRFVRQVFHNKIKIRAA